MDIQYYDKDKHECKLCGCLLPDRAEDIINHTCHPEALLNRVTEPYRNAPIKKEVIVEEKAVVARPETGLEVSAEQARKGLSSIKEFQNVVHQNMVKGRDYGVIPGTDKPTLLKPGAEKLAKLMLCADKYEIIKEVEDWEKPFFSYQVKCRLESLSSGKIISEGLGSINSYESKYRYRWVFGSDVPSNLDKSTLVSKKRFSKKTNKEFLVYRIDNDDIFSQVNTLLKMAKKRALVDAALSAGRLSEVFTQDLEDTSEDNGEYPEAETTSIPNTKEQIKDIVKELKVELQAKFLDKLGKEYSVSTIDELNEAQAEEILAKLKREFKK